MKRIVFTTLFVIASALMSGHSLRVQDDEPECIDGIKHCLNPEMFVFCWEGCPPPPPPGGGLAAVKPAAVAPVRPCKIHKR